MGGARARWLAVAGTGGRAGRLARLGAAAVAVALAGLLAGCGSVTWGGSERAGGAQRGGPAAGTPGAALRLDRPDVKVTGGGCLTDQITIDGKAQPILQDSGTLSAAITRLLGVTARP